MCTVCSECRDWSDTKIGAGGRCGWWLLDVDAGWTMEPQPGEVDSCQFYIYGCGSCIVVYFFVLLRMLMLSSVVTR